MSQIKIEKIRSHEKFDRLDALLIVKPENILYILGFKVESQMSILIPSEGPISAFFPALEFDQAKANIEQDKELSSALDIHEIPPSKPKYVLKYINKQGIKTLGYEDDFISVKRFNEWKEKFKINKYEPTSDILTSARLTKTKEEINRMEEASKLGDVGFKTIHDKIEIGMTEKELAAEAEYEMRKAGSDGTSFDTIVASGENSAYPHSTTSEKKIEDGDLIIVDIGAKYRGYCSDMTRTFIFGKVETQKAELVNMVSSGQQHVLEKIQVNMKCSELDKIARDYFIQAKPEWGNRFIHGLGHGVGIDIHENPFINPLSKHHLKENMVVTVEPGLYIPGLGGARTEDMVVITPNGYLTLTKSKKYNY